MKKICLTLLAVVCAGILFTGCSKSTDVDYSRYSAYTTTFTLNKSSWTAQAGGGYEIQKTISDINSDITDGGAVWIYFSYDGGNTYELLPSLGIPDNNNVAYNFYGTSGDDNNGQAGYVILTAYGANSNNVAAPDVTINVKVVSIPAYTVSQISNINKNDYNAVKAAFHLNK